MPLPHALACCHVISKAMEAAPDSATNLWSREFEDEDWVESGVLPPEGQTTMRFDARGVRTSDDAGVEGSRGRGTAEQSLTRGWTEQMSKFLERGSGVEYQRQNEQLHAVETADSTGSVATCVQIPIAAPLITTASSE